MKNLMNYLKLACLLSLIVVLTSCNNTTDPPSDPLTIAANLVNGKVAKLSEAHTAPANATHIAFVVDTFSVTFTGDKTGGTYTSTSSTDAQLAVWPSSGTWTFKDDTGTKIVRDGKVLMTVSIGELGVTYSFDPTDTGGKTEIIAGNWSFKFLF